MNGNMNENRLSLRGKTKNMSTGVWAMFQKTGRIICLGGVAVVLLFVMACSNAETDIGTNWRYTGEELWNVFNEARSDEGAIYVVSSRHGSLISMYLPITVMQATKNGNLVQCGKGDKQLDSLIWVVSPGKRYLDGEPLRDGYYIRRGSHEYTNVRGEECTVARYVEVTDKNVLLEIEKAQQELMAKRKAEEEAREAREAQRKAEEEAQRRAEEEARKEAAEQGAYELDIPVKSLCGFKLGAPPSQVQHLLLDDDAPVEDLYRIPGGWIYKFQLAKPFRLFTHAAVSFIDGGVGKHLQSVTLSVPLEENVLRTSYVTEAKTLSELIQKKYGIKFGEWSDSLDRVYWDGRRYGEEIEIGIGNGELYLTVKVDYMVISELDIAEHNARKTNIQLDPDVGFDNL